jgi:hypothetical protein
MAKRQQTFQRAARKRKAQRKLRAEATRQESETAAAKPSKPSKPAETNATPDETPQE